MKKALLCCSILILVGIRVEAQSKFETYTNSRYFFSIDYPSDLLKMRPPSRTGDGQIFVSKDGLSELRVWAMHNVLFHSVAKEFAWRQKHFDNKNLTYKKLSNTWFVLAGVSGDKIFYEKTLYHKFENTDLYFTFTIQYPKTEKSKFDNIVKRIEKSFKFDPNADV